MTDRPIIFSVPMIRAIIDGRKTQTRRVLGVLSDRNAVWAVENTAWDVGDRIWVRETWAVGNIYDGVAPRDINPYGKPGWCGIRYAATDYRLGINDRPSIHMPRWASRITLTVTDVRAQHLQDISEDDARAEGCLWVPGHGEITPTDLSEGYSNYLNCREGFQVLWDSLNAKRGHGWDANPWVAAISFTTELRNIDAEGEA